MKKAVGFLGAFVQEKAKQLGQGFLSMIVAFDPETASEAEINQLDGVLTDLTQRMVKAKLAYEKELREAEAAKKKYNEGLAAVDILESKGQSASAAALIAELEKMQSSVEREIAEAEDAKELFKQLEEAVITSSEKLKTARNRLADAQRRLEKAKISEQRAKEMEENAKVLAGIKKEASGLGIAFDKMTQEAEDVEARAAAAKEKAKLLSNPVAGDSNIEAALKEARGESTVAPSTEERKAALKRF